MRGCPKRAILAESAYVIEQEKPAALPPLIYRVIGA